MQQAIVHLMPKSRLKTEIFEYEINIFQNHYKKENIINIIFYKGESINNKEILNAINGSGIDICNYQNKKELKEKLLELTKNTQILYINTTSELLINVSNEMKKALGQKVCDNSKIFRNKYLQRELLQKENLTNGVRFLKGTIKQLDYDQIEKKVGVPFILKPTNGIQSSGVVKINNKKDFTEYKYHYSYFHENCHDRGFESDLIIAEEFIDGKLYSIDYFVSESGEIISSRPVLVETGIDLGIQDYFNGIMTISADVENDFDEKDLKGFITTTVQATGIRNTFIHHEFKINSAGDLKTIEINGRIGGGRVEMLHKAYGIDLYGFVFGKKQLRKKLKNNFSKINIYAPYRGKLLGFNENLLEQVKNMQGVYEIEKPFAMIGKEVGLTKDGFIKVITIKLSNPELGKLKKDKDFIIKSYQKFLYIDQESKFTSFMHVIKTFTYKFPSRKKS